MNDVTPETVGQVEQMGERLDRWLSQASKVSREQAQRWITSKRIVFRLADALPWQIAAKVSLKLPVGAQVARFPDPEDCFVSRGGQKLQAAVDKLKQLSRDEAIDQWVALDIGQSTGGFTDCLLQAGARRVVGIEVGHNQLVPSLRQDARVICYEKMNARELPHDTLLSHTDNNLGFDAAVMDVSFISQRLILPNLIPLLRAGGWLLSLVKPQFELGKAHIGKGGLVSSPELYPQLQQEMTDFCQSLGLCIRAYQESPIQGGDGNTEFLLIAQKQ